MSPLLGDGVAYTGSCTTHTGVHWHTVQSSPSYIISTNQCDKIQWSSLTDTLHHRTELQAKALTDCLLIFYVLRIKTIF